MNTILSPPRVVLDFNDGAGVPHHVELLWDFAAPIEFSDPCSVARHIGRRHDLSPEAEIGVRAAIDSQLHNAILTALKAADIPLTPSTVPSLAAAQATSAAGIASRLETDITMARRAADYALRAKSSQLSMTGSAAAAAKLSAIATFSAAAAGDGSAAATMTPGLIMGLDIGIGKKGRRTNSQIHASRLLQQLQRQDAVRRATGGSAELAAGVAAAASEALTAAAGAKRARLADQKNVSAVAGNEEEDIDDGNVEYCAKCDNDGEVICCDRCPRSYHPGCLGLTSVPDDALWFCENCVRVFGANREFENSASGPVCTIYYDGPFPPPQGQQATVYKYAKFIKLELTAICNHLADHEFGEIFKEPVDVAAVPGYADIVKRPMDYGTILKQLGSGFYLRYDGSFDVARAIADLRLVPYNARLYNKPGSTIWRYADELSRETETMVRDRMLLSQQDTALLLVLRLLETPSLPKWGKFT